VTVPVAAVGATVAVKVTLAPAATEELDEASVVVVAVVPVLVLVPVGGSQKPLHPARNSATVRGAIVKATATGRSVLMRLVNMVKSAFLSQVDLRALRPLRC
jgi:hypothetical protein